LGTGAISIVLLFLLVFFSWQTVYSANKDLIRAKAWREMARRALPFGALLLMALSLLVVQGHRQSWVLVTWMVVAGLAIISSSFLSVSGTERKANKAFRSGDYERATDLYRGLIEENPLARNYAFFGAALGASGKRDESVKASSEAIKKDPQYGLAYYNRALILGQQNKKSRAVKDLKKALESDLPKRFRSSAKRMLKDIE
jgi:tetratricopeptide (TPR) repeat protein